MNINTVALSLVGLVFIFLAPLAYTDKKKTYVSTFFLTYFVYMPAVLMLSTFPWGGFLFALYGLFIWVLNGFSLSGFSGIQVGSVYYSLFSAYMICIWFYDDLLNCKRWIFNIKEK